MGFARPLYNTLSSSFRLIALFMACRTLTFAQGSFGSNLPVVPRYSVAPRDLVLGAEVEPAEIDLHLLRGGSAPDELVAFRDQFVGEVLVDLGEMGFARDQLRKARRFFEGPRHLDLFPVHHAMLPVRGWRPLVQDIPVQLSLFEDVRP